MKVLTTVILTLLALSTTAFAGYTEKFEKEFRAEFKSKHGIELGPKKTYSTSQDVYGSPPGTGYFYVESLFFDPADGRCYQDKSDWGWTTRSHVADSECVYLKGPSKLVQMGKAVELFVPSIGSAYLAVLESAGITYCSVGWEDRSGSKLTSYSATVHPSYCEERLK